MVKTKNPGWIEFAKSSFTDCMKGNIYRNPGQLVDCADVLAVLSDSKHGPSGTSESAHGDTPQSALSTGTVLGSFAFTLQDVIITYEACGCCPSGAIRLYYRWTGTLRVGDALGLQPHGLGYYIGGVLFKARDALPSRPIIRGKIQISGDGYVCL